MSGFEIAGVVLGVLPLLIEGLKLVSLVSYGEADSRTWDTTDVSSIKMVSKRDLK